MAHSGRLSHTLLDLPCSCAGGAVVACGRTETDLNDLVKHVASLQLPGTLEVRLNVWAQEATMKCLIPRSFFCNLMQCHEFEREMPTSWAKLHSWHHINILCDVPWLLITRITGSPR